MSLSVFTRLIESVHDYVLSDIIIDCVIGRKYVGIHSKYGTGLAFTSDEAWREAERLGPERMESAFRGTSLSEAVAGYADVDPLRSALGLAAINSFHSQKGEPDPLTWFQNLRGKKRLGMVGYFYPIMDRLALTGIEPVIFELRPLPGTHRPEEAEQLMPTCDVVLITGASFANKSVDHYIPFIAPDAEAFIFGHSTPLADFLLERFTLGSAAVLDKDAVFTAIRSGLGLRGFKEHIRKVIQWKKAP